MNHPRSTGSGQADKASDPSPLPELNLPGNETIERLEEIGKMLGCSTRSILRKLTLIRTLWDKEEAG